MVDKPCCQRLRTGKETNAETLGIVTNFEMTAVKHDAWCEVRVVAHADSAKYMEALIPFSDAIENDTHASIIFNETAEITVVVMFYTAAVDNKPKIFEPFYDLPYLTHLVPPAKRTIAQILQAVKDVNQPGIPRCHDFATASSLPDLEAYKAGAEARLKVVEELKGTSVEAVMVIQPLSSLMVQACQKMGGNPLGLDPRGQQCESKHHCLLMCTTSNSCFLSFRVLG